MLNKKAKTVYDFLSGGLADDIANVRREMIKAGYQPPDSLTMAERKLRTAQGTVLEWLEAVRKQQAGLCRHLRIKEGKGSIYPLMAEVSLARRIAKQYYRMFKKLHEAITSGDGRKIDASTLNGWAYYLSEGPTKMSELAAMLRRVAVFLDQIIE